MKDYYVNTLSVGPMTPPQAQLILRTATEFYTPVAINMNPCFLVPYLAKIYL